MIFMAKTGKKEKDVDINIRVNNIEKAIKAGMKTIKQDGIEKALQGHTDMSQVRSACRN